MNENNYTYFVYEVKKDKYFIATCIELPSLKIYGKTKKKALKNIKNKIKILFKEGKKMPAPLEKLK